MPWAPGTISSADVVAIHAGLVPTANGDGEIIMIGGDDHDLAAARASQFDHSRTFNCRVPSQALGYVASPPKDLFCCGHAFLGDGRLLVAGGTNEFPPDAAGPHMGHHFEGHRGAWAYNPFSRQFEQLAEMGPQPGREPLGGGRWYPTLCTLSSGEVLALAGHPLGSDTRHYNNTPERYLPLIDGWAMLPAVGVDGGNPDLFPRTHVLRNGRVFVSSALQGLAGNTAIDATTGQATVVCGLPDPAYRGFDCPSVLLPLVPTDGYRPRVLLGGGLLSQFIDVEAAGAAWTNVPRAGVAANRSRGHANATILPTGDVLLTGGADGNDQQSVAEPEIYRTPLDRLTRTYQSGSGSWETLNEPSPRIRNYHSTALLMPDGRVWTAGGNSPDQPGQPPTALQKTIDIYQPPYPAGPRPVIFSAPGLIAYGDAFSVEVGSAEAIGSVVLLRCGSATHAFNPDQRAVYCELSARGTTTLLVQAPSSAAVAPPGWYMLFVVDKGGRPCEWARFVRVGGSLSMFTDRSTISQPEIDAQLAGGTPAFISSAFYVVLDGFAASDLAGTLRPFPPNVSFRFADDQSVVPGLAAEMTSVLYESPSAGLGVTQRITLPYRLRFDNPSAFQGIAAGDQRQVTVNVKWGSTQTSAPLTLFRREHVYALDGPVSWLSIDVRVLRLPRGTTYLPGIGNVDPVPFVRNVIARFRATPTDEFHPFLQLSTDQTASRLELSDTVNGNPVDNFAFAKVRFRAPAGVNATDVKVFFRLFQTAVTDLVYNDTTTYRRSGNGAAAVPQLGTVGAEIATIPFFAAPRSPTETDPTNVVTLQGAGAGEVYSYFGAWLDFNHDASLRNLLRGRHQCLVAEIHYPPNPIPSGTTPSNNDQLSQRNLLIEASDNPGGPDAHTVAHTFDLRAPAGIWVDPADTTMVATRLRPASRPDELFIRWYGLPREAIATVFLASGDAARQVELASRMRPGAGVMQTVDARTVRFRIGDAVYLPLLQQPTNLAGLLSIQLPPGLPVGNVYRVTAHQVGGFPRHIIGSFELSVPITRGPLLLDEELRDYHILREVGNAIPAGNRWREVFDRYLEILAGRVRGFGGDPSAVAGDSTPDASAGAKRFRGKIISIRYDHAGDPEEFVLASALEQHTFRVRERRLIELVREAGLHRFTVTVEVSPAHPDRPLQIVIGYN